MCVSCGLSQPETVMCSSPSQHSYFPAWDCQFQQRTACLLYSCLWEEGWLMQANPWESWFKALFYHRLQCGNYLGSEAKLSVCTTAITACLNIKIYPMCKWMLWFCLVEENKYAQTRLTYVPVSWCRPLALKVSQMKRIFRHARVFQRV